MLMAILRLKVAFSDVRDKRELITSWRSLKTLYKDFLAILGPHVINFTLLSDKSSRWVFFSFLFRSPAS